MVDDIVVKGFVLLVAGTPGSHGPDMVATPGGGPTAGTGFALTRGAGVYVIAVGRLGPVKPVGRGGPEAVPFARLGA